MYVKFKYIALVRHTENTIELSSKIVFLYFYNI